MKSLDVNPPIGPDLLACAHTSGIVTAVARSIDPNQAASMVGDSIPETDGKDGPPFAENPGHRKDYHPSHGARTRCLSANGLPTLCRLSCLGLSSPEHSKPSAPECGQSASVDQSRTKRRLRFHVTSRAKLGGPLP